MSAAHVGRMMLTTPRTWAIALSACFLMACSAAGPDSLSDGMPVPDEQESSDAITASYPVGSILKTTANVNFRKGPSTSYGVIDIVSKAEQVTLVQSAPSSGFYKVSHDGSTGWISGKYLSLVSTGGGTGGSSGGTDNGGTDGQPWSCSGSYAKTPVAGGNYYATSFGCWVDENGKSHSDSGDNCIPGCLSKAQSDGLCAGMSGPTCERKVNWFAADAGRFGCLARLRVTHPDNGKCVVLVVLDYGPACWVENSVSHGIIDMSSRATDYLFDSQMGASDKAAIKVEVVSSSTPLGPC